jgi:hypothetical protein
MTISEDTRHALTVTRDSLLTSALSSLIMVGLALGELLHSRAGSPMLLLMGFSAIAFAMLAIMTFIEARHWAIREKSIPRRHLWEQSQ